ncbi:winged helix-turn-helix domain-containing protein [Kitasatospora sp. NPDC049285]|uniref:ArsR/SmtB family transcription factor n=1 Tax=Kitasatospora sp. NPDC049285 TaxID=3157096 RepID=UPI00344AD99F
MRTRLALSVGDLARTRFAVSPMWEVVTSFRALAASPVPTPHRSWAAQVRPRLAAAGLDRGWLAAMIPPSGHLPDFLNPAPTGHLALLDEELTAIRATDPALVRHDLDCLRADREGALPARLRALEREPDEALRRVAAEIEAYWELALAPYWARIRTVLEADVFQRARQVAEQGSAGMLGELHGTVRWDGETLHLSERHCAVTRIATGAGLLLIPSVFAWPRVLTRSVGPDPAPAGGAPTQLCYPALAAATVWERRPHPRGDGLAQVVGRSRAQLLTELDSPASTTDLARRCGLSPAAVSQHLTALRTAGLVSSHRAGRSVLYARTGVADGWLDGAG